mmetsp:Transcript_4914/g.7315  ORF Transcript_4914/g.7315 Transcript_4914/m.7315 type:complete len:140 (-) Transcript_4914:681-1100(-)
METITVGDAKEEATATLASFVVVTAASSVALFLLDTRQYVSTPTTAMRRVPTTTTTIMIISVFVPNEDDAPVDEDDDNDDCWNEVLGIVVGIIVEGTAVATANGVVLMVGGNDLDNAEALNLSKSIDPNPVTGSHPFVA